MNITAILTDHPKAKPELITVVFERKEVEALDLGGFLGQFGEDVLPDGEDLASLMGRFVFFVEGYDDDPRELYTIDEVRTFYQTLCRRWPYLFFFCDVGTGGLMILTACCMKDLSCVKHKGFSATMITVDTSELSEFIAEGLWPMNVLFERANLPESANEGRTAEIIEYYNTPLDHPF